MEALLPLPRDVVGGIYEMLGTRDLAALAVVVALPEWAWTHNVRRRCGTLWPKGKAGFYRLRHAVYGVVTPLAPCAVPCGTSALAACAAGPWGANVWCRLDHVHGSLFAKYINCVEAITTSTVALGHGQGVYICTPEEVIPVWLGVKVTSVAYVLGHKLWICTAHHRAYEYNLHTYELGELDCGAHAFTASGPVAVLGTSRGVWPLARSIEVECVRIVQSSVHIAALNICGHLAIYAAVTTQQLYAVETGLLMAPSAPPFTFSIVGDIVRLCGMTYSGGRCTGSCPDDYRTATPDGRLLCALQCGMLGTHSL